MYATIFCPKQGFEPQTFGSTIRLFTGGLLSVLIFLGSKSSQFVFILMCFQCLPKFNKTHYVLMHWKCAYSKIKSVRGLNSSEIQQQFYCYKGTVITHQKILQRRPPTINMTKFNNLKNCCTNISLILDHFIQLS